jgi:hypothetical protein
MELKVSRTTRRKGTKNYNPFYTLEWQMRDRNSDAIHPPQLDPKSKEGKKCLARFYSDKYSSFKEPGPAWYRNLLTERPQRRYAKHQLALYMKDTETEVILNSKDPLDYWT